MSAPDGITWRSWFVVAILGLTWGGTFLVTEVALEGITPFWLAAGRITFAAMLMSAIWIQSGAKLFETPPDRDAKMLLVASGILSSAVPFMLLAWGQQFVTGGFAGVSMAAVALMVLPMAHFMVPNERLTVRKTVGFLIGFIGVVVLVGAQAFESSGSNMETWGRLACLAAAMCYGINSILMRRLPAIDTIGLSTVIMIMAMFITVPAALIVEGLPPMPDTNTLLVIAFLGLIPTAAANFLRTYVIRTAGPVFMSLTNYQVPIWSVVLGALLLGEPLPATLLLAMVLILAGVGLSQYGAIRRLFRP